MRSIKSLAVGAGFCFVTLAMFVQGFLPAILPERTYRVVARLSGFMAKSREFRAGR